MIKLVMGLVLFIGIHALPWRTAWRQQCINKLGYKGYRGLFSLLSVIGLVLIVWGKATADFQSLWLPPNWGRGAAIPLMLITLILIPAANLPCNIKRWVRHPMLLGIILWSSAHLIANGDVASVALFGSFAVYSVIAILSANARGKNANLPVLPTSKDILVIVIGIIAFGGLLIAHPYLFGVAVIN